MEALLGLSSHSELLVRELSRMGTILQSMNRA